VIDRLRLAGTESQLLTLIAGLDRSRVVPYLVLLDGEDSLSQSLEPADCPVLRLGVRSLHRPAALRKAWQLARFLRQQRIDVVQMHFPDSTYFAAPAARWAGVRHVLRTRRDLGFWMRPIDRWLCRLYNRLATATIANCQACREAVIAQEGAAPNTVTVLENGIDLDLLTRLPPPDPTAERPRRIVGMVANLRPVKGPDVFIRAAAILAPRYPDVQFQIAGTGDEPSARRWIGKCHLEDRFELLGSVANLAPMLGNLDVAVLTSLSEGLSNALLEYMAAARPIVATAVGASGELIADGVHGLLVPPGDAEAVARAVGRLLDDRDFAAGLATAARHRAEQRYSRRAMIDRYEEFYRHLVHGH
jgi:glycosyltransferase involved in cell wall biosynthesis